MSKEKRLGKGLQALLGTPGDVAEATATARADGPHLGGPHFAASTASTSDVQRVNVYELDSNPFQPRKDFDEAEINALAESLREHGLIQPIVVRKVGSRFQLIAGERRMRAAIKAGWSEIPARVVDVGDRQVAELALVENLQRKDLNPLEKAASFQQYLERYGCTKEELASRLQIDRSTVANIVRLLELPESVQAALASGTISTGHARALLPLEEREQIALCQRIRAEDLSVRELEIVVQETISDTMAARPIAGTTKPPPKARRRSPRNEHLSALEQELRTALGTRVDLTEAQAGRGKIVIHFHGHDEFERLFGLLCGER